MMAETVTMGRVVRRVRFVILGVFGGRCVYCGKRAILLDHFIPFAKCQHHLPENLIGACRQCNTIKANHEFKTIPEVALYIADRSPGRIGYDHFYRWYAMSQSKLSETLSAHAQMAEVLQCAVPDFALLLPEGAGFAGFSTRKGFHIVRTP